MSKAQIESWLNGKRDYKEGIKLYDLLGTNQFLKGVFKSGEKHSSRQRMVEEFFGMLKNDLPANVPKNESINAPVIYNPKLSDEEYAALPPEGRDLKREINDWYNEKNHLRAKLMDMLTMEERYEAAKKIVALDKLIKQGWFRIDYWKLYKELPPNDLLKVNLPELTQMELMKKRNNLRSYISKFKEAADRLEDVKKWRNELSEVERRLDEPV